MPAAFDRPDVLRRLANTHFDVLVIGGGITGAGCALDAASRGLRTALVERDDFASGTSSKSSKLVHGGLRYLQQGDVRLVYEALHERQRLRHNAPHLVRILPFLLPVFTGRGGVVPKKLSRALGSAMWMYDLTGGYRIGKLHKRISPREALEHMPTLRTDRLAASYLYYDAQADDARLTLTVARTAALDFGAAVANGVGVLEILKDSAGRARGVRAAADGEELEIRADAVVNAAGVWADEVRALDEGADPHTIRPAKGVHITVPWAKVRNDIAAVVPVPKDKRSVFVVPWGAFTYIGTTDTDYDGPLDDPQCTRDDIDYLLRAINFSVTSEITERDITGTWAGLRPLVRDAASERTADLSRRHRVQRSPSGVVTITGGKLTTYREMAAETIDEVLEHVLGAKVLERAQRHSRTKRLRLRGAAGYEELRSSELEASRVGRATLEHLADRYGGEARTLLAMIERDPGLSRPLVEGLPYLRAEAVYAARYEMARSLDDILSRRTRARLLGRDASAAAAPEVAALVAPDLGWDRTEQARQVDDYRQQVEHERHAPDLPETALDAAMGA
ncbi:glycerol-3-phosphate dehydrogenase/oxidase [Rhabdothermincola sp.]|uniref:glycerol-3-phosphate dehydrogenase/oxidase n=1 Tax=Rhabdothermincola sp. TaxID=2820405 RepID=UPI002FE2B3E5